MKQSCLKCNCLVSALLQAELASVGSLVSTAIDCGCCPLGGWEAGGVAVFTGPAESQLSTLVSGSADTVSISLLPCVMSAPRPGLRSRCSGELCGRRVCMSCSLNLVLVYSARVLVHGAQPALGPDTLRVKAVEGRRTFLYNQLVDLVKFL